MSAGVDDQQGAELPQLAAMDSAPLAVVATDLDGRVLYANAAAEALYGHSREDMIRSGVFETLVRAVDQQTASDIVATVISGQVWSGEFAVQRPDGSAVRTHVDDVPLWRDGHVVGIVGFGRLVEDTGDDSTSASDSATLLAELGRVTAGLAGADDAATVAELVVERAADAFGSDVASLSLLGDDGLLHLMAIRGVPDGTREEFITYPADDTTPVGQAVVHGRMVLVSGRDDFERRYPALQHQGGERSLIAVPLIVGERTLGGMSLSFSGRKTFSPTDSLFLRPLADTTAQALARLEAAATAQARSRKLSILAEAAAELASSLDFETTLTNVARLALDELADWVGVELLEDGRLVPVVTMHRDPAMIDLAGELRSRYPTTLDDLGGVPAVIRSGISELHEQVTDEAMVAGARDAEHLALLRRLGLESLMIVPLTTRDRVLGALTLVSSDPARRYGAEDLSFAEDLGRRAAVAIDNSQLYRQTLEASVRLQHALLPESLPDMDDYRLAVHYRPAGRTEVGGDFYDATRLADGRLVVVIGDVMGRGVNAAAAMAQLRAATRAYIAVDPDPAGVLEALTRMYAFYRTGGLATVLVALADASAGAVRFAAAGHLPPLVIRTDGSAEIIQVPTSPPLGVGTFVRSEHVVQFCPGDTMLLYSDGLVESRDQDIDRGIARLIDAIKVRYEVAADVDLHALAAELVPMGQDDDVTLLAVRRPPSTRSSHP